MEVENLCSATQILPASQLALGLAMFHSLNETTSKDGAKFLRSRLKELQPGSVPSLPEPLLHLLLMSLSKNELDEVLPPSEHQALVELLVDAHANVTFDQGILTGLDAEVQKIIQARLDHQEKMRVADAQINFTASSSQLSGGLRLCEIVEEDSTSGNISVAVRNAVQRIPGPNSRSLAEVLAVVIRLAGRQADQSQGQTSILGSLGKDVFPEDGKPMPSSGAGSEGGSLTQRQDLPLCALSVALPSWALRLRLLPCISRRRSFWPPDHRVLPAAVPSPLVPLSALAALWSPRL